MKRNKLTLKEIEKNIITLLGDNDIDITSTKGVAITKAEILTHYNSEDLKPIVTSLTKTIEEWEKEGDDQTIPLYKAMVEIVEDNTFVSIWIDETGSWYSKLDTKALLDMNKFGFVSYDDEDNKVESDDSRYKMLFDMAEEIII